MCILFSYILYIFIYYFTDTFEVGDEISNLIVVATGDNNVVSLRETVGYKLNKLKVPYYKSLSKNTLIRCSLLKDDLSEIIVQSPVKGNQGVYKIPKKVSFVILNFH